MRFSLLSLLLLTTVIGVALATTIIAAIQDNGRMILDVTKFIVVFLSATALTTGILSSGRIQVFCLTWGIFVVTQDLCHSTPLFVKEMVENALIPPQESSERVTHAVTYVFEITGIWFDIGVATIAACVAVMLSTSKRLENYDIQCQKEFEQNENE